MMRTPRFRRRLNPGVAFVLHLCAVVLLCGPLSAADAPRMSYLDNGTLKLGIDLSIGGSITYLGPSGTETNLINSHDWGRQIQMSFYGGPNPYTVGDKKPRPDWAFLGWNPVQSGDCHGKRARVLQHTNDGKSLYVKCVPMQWPMDDVPGECTFECWISLENNAAIVRARINNDRSDRTQYPGRHQECPAVYTNGPWWRLMTYTGDKPFTNDTLTQIEARFPWSHYRANECWSALVDDNNWGLGLWNEGVYSATGGFAGKPGKGGPKDSPTGYFAPLTTEILDHNIQHEYRYVLILGKLEEIRKYVYDRARRPAPPKYRFNKDRAGWVYHGLKDGGWPIKGELCILPQQKNGSMVGPQDLWPAEAAPKLRLHAAFDTAQTNLRIRFSPLAGDAGGGLPLAVTADGQYRTYELDLSTAKEYRGLIANLRIDIPAAKRAGETVRVQWIELGI